MKDLLIKNNPRAKILAAISLLFLAVALALIYLTITLPPAPNPDQIKWGLTFSKEQSVKLGLNWQDNYLAALNELQPSGIRLIAGWDEIEPTKGQYSFADLDWQVEQASQRNTPFIIAIGQKTPRWPECHWPVWVANDKTARQIDLLNYEKAVITRYQTNPQLLYWQVENEPYLNFGQCRNFDRSVIDKEITQVKAFDNHPILMTDGGAWGKWYPAITKSDVFGTTLYTKVYNSYLGSSRPPWPPIYYALKKSLMSALTGRQPDNFIVTEVGLEPWGGKDVGEMTSQEQTDLLTLPEFRRTLAFARATRFDTFYLWGVEWWYQLKLQGVTAYWDTVRAAMSPNSQPAAQSFPAGFLWGAASSSHQTEGNNNNDWTKWEQANAARLAKEADSAIPAARNADNYLSGRATDAYNRYAQDSSLAQALGLSAQRISFEWSRLEPQRGQFDQAAITHYQQVIDDMKAKGQEPFVTLNHWTLPPWLSAQGGWSNPATVTAYTSYVNHVVPYFQDRVRYWLTINEPGVYAANAYLSGKRPPNRHNPILYLRALNNLARAHRAAYRAIKTSNPSAQVGLAQDIYSYQSHWWSASIARLARWWTNERFINQLNGRLDFIGLNYYRDITLGYRADRYCPANKKSDLGWKLCPAGIYPVLQEMKKYNLPLYVTENGLADANDINRAWFIETTLRHIQQAISAGVPVKGYFYWSLTDNFEWEKGFWPRFGLAAVDYRDLSRTLRPSAQIFSKIISQNGF